MSNNKHLDIVALQYKPFKNMLDNLEFIIEMLNKNNIKKGTLVVCPELSLQNYICLTKDESNFIHAISIQDKIIEKLKNIAKQYEIYLCITIFEKCKNNFFNTAVIINNQGRIIKKYNKKYIPSEICYEEKYYFDIPKNDFKYFTINNFKIGILICWDQWHAESYLKLKQKNVNLIICPTAIGTCIHNKQNKGLKDEKKKWLEVIKSNSLMHNIPILVTNRSGKESTKKTSINFWGLSFLTDANGSVIKKCRSKSGILSHSYRIDDQISAKKMWNFIDINK
mgnify:CR=1 FL=1